MLLLGGDCRCLVADRGLKWLGFRIELFLELVAVREYETISCLVVDVTTFRWITLLPEPQISITLAIVDQNLAISSLFD